MIVYKIQTNTVKQHIQDVINHGHSFTVYRTYDNITNGANASIHAFLCSVEDHFNKRRANGDQLPHTIYFQVVLLISCVNLN